MASIEKRTGKKGDSFTVRWYESSSDGNTRKRRATFASQREAKAHQRKIEQDIADGTYVGPSKETVGAYLDRWLESIASTVKGATAYRYLIAIRTHLKPALGSVLLTKLSSSDVQC